MGVVCPRRIPEDEPISFPLDTIVKISKRASAQSSPVNLAFVFAWKALLDVPHVAKLMLIYVHARVVSMAPHRRLHPVHIGGS